MKIVFGLVGALGTNFKKVINPINSIMNPFGFDNEKITLSKYIEKKSDKIKSLCELELKDDSCKEKYESYMDGGNILRYCSEKNDFLALKAIEEINDKHSKNKNIVYILKSLKNPDEVNILRDTYSDSFFLIGIYSSESNRKSFLEDKNLDSDIVEKLIRKDENENAYSRSTKNMTDFISTLDDDDKKKFWKACQKTQDVYSMADIYISIDGNVEFIEKQVKRFIDLTFGNPRITPTQDEYGMYHAYAAALRSGSLARQVGAAILSKHGDLVSAGCNDAPKAGGGLYWPSDFDKRDVSHEYDSNNKHLAIIIDQIKKEISEQIEKCNIKGSKQKIKDILIKSKLKDITEYGRTVHAEMEAILSCCRNGIITKGCDMFVTLFSCHNCTKHLICAGIKRVVYVEPYPKSYAEKLYGNEIHLKNQTDCDIRNKVVFEPFIGISGRRYFDLFSMEWGSGKLIKRKNDDDGSICNWMPSKAKFRFQIMDEIHDINEKLAIKELRAAEKKLKDKAPNLPKQKKR